MRNEYPSDITREQFEKIRGDLEGARKPNGITKADREAHKSDDLIKRNFRAAKPLEKGVTDITEIPAKD